MYAAQSLAVEEYTYSAYISALIFCAFLLRNSQ